MKKTFASLASMMMAVACSAATIEQVCVRQQWPWEGRVRIDYALKSELGEVVDIGVTIRNSEGETVMSSSAAFSGDLVEVYPGERTIWWDPSKSGLSLSELPQLKFVLTAETDPQRYCIIDIATAGAYGVSYAAKAPEGGWNADEYKTTKIVLRHVKPGDFMMGSPEDEPGRRAETSGNNIPDMPQHRVTLTTDYWLGIFPITFKQASLVHGSEFGKTGTYVGNQTDTSPASNLSYDDLMGALVPPQAEWTQPTADSWIGTLSGSITSGTLPAGAYLSLPTEAQWEYACRAGTTTAYNNGSDSLGSDGPAFPSDNPMCPVGGYRPSAWGFYNMHGCVWQWTCESMSYGGGTTAQIDPFRPFGAGDLWPALRGGSYGTTDTADHDNRSASRFYLTCSVRYDRAGARLAMVKKPTR